jgi:hypothetical protein
MCPPSPAQDQREQRLKLPEDFIGQSVAESQRGGELRTARRWGKLLDMGDGYNETPAVLRMSFKSLKVAGLLPPEVELMQGVESLRQAAAAAHASGVALVKYPGHPW